MRRDARLFTCCCCGALAVDVAARTYAWLIGIPDDGRPTGIYCRQCRGTGHTPADHAAAAPDGGLGPYASP